MPDLKRAHGRVMAVSTHEVGAKLSDDVGAGATTLVVVNAVQFPTTGQLVINDQVIAYSDVDYDTGAITLAGPLGPAAEAGDQVSVYDSLYEKVVTEKRALVQFDGDMGDGDALDVAVALHLTDRLQDGIRGASGGGESVLLELEHSEWRIIDAIGQGQTAAGPGGSAAWWDDQFTLPADGAPQSVALTYLPISLSEDVKLNGLGQRRLIDWTREDQTVTLTEPHMAAGDIVDVHYQYIPGLSLPPAPAEPLTSLVVRDSASAQAAYSGESILTTLPPGVQPGDRCVMAVQGQGVNFSGGGKYSIIHAASSGISTGTFKGANALVLSWIHEAGDLAGPTLGRLDSSYYGWATAAFVGDFGLGRKVAAAKKQENMPVVLPPLDTGVSIGCSGGNYSVVDGQFSFPGTTNDPAALGWHAAASTGSAKCPATVYYWNSPTTQPNSGPSPSSAFWGQVSAWNVTESVA